MEAASGRCSSAESSARWPVSTDRWLPFTPGRKGIDLPPMYCLPPAGAGASTFRSWQSQLWGVAEVCPIQLPGREIRLHEEPISDLSQLVAGLTEVVNAKGAAGYVLVGHSFGALVAFELVRLMRRQGLPMPDLFIAIAAAAPQLSPQAGLAVREDVDGLEFLRRVNGTPEEVLRDPSLMELVLPALRDDLFMYKNYIHDDEPPLNVPILALAGRHDPVVTTHSVAAWHAQTSIEFRFEILEGGHFFPIHAPDLFEAVIEMIGKHSRKPEDEIEFLRSNSSVT